MPGFHVGHFYLKMGSNLILNSALQFQPFSYLASPVTKSTKQRTMYISKIISFYFSFAILLLTLSCKDKKVASNLDCGCEGSTVDTVSNRQARHIGNGYFQINKMNVNGNLTYGWACDIDSTWQISSDENSWNYTISANIKAFCPDPRDIYVSRMPGSPIKITVIRKN